MRIQDTTPSSVPLERGTIAQVRDVVADAQASQRRSASAWSRGGSSGR